MAVEERVDRILGIDTPDATLPARGVVSPPSAERLAQLRDNALQQYQAWARPQLRLLKTKSWRPAIAAAALLTIAITIWLWPNSRVTLQVDGQLVNLHEAPFSSGRKVMHGKIGTEVKLSLRQVKRLTGRVEGKNLLLNLTSGKLLVRFLPGETIESMTIYTPTTTFRVVGTTFLIDATRSEAALLVTKGRVVAKDTDSRSSIGKNQFWTSYGEGTLKLAAGKRALKAFHVKKKFKLMKELLRKGEAKVANKPAAQKTSKKKGKQTRQTILHLENGEKIVGDIIMQDEQYVTIRTNVSDSFKIRREMISKIVKPKR